MHNILRVEFYNVLENWKKDENDYYAKDWTIHKIYHKKGEISIQVFIGNIIELGSFSKKIIIKKNFTTYAQLDKTLDVMKDINKFHRVVKLADKEFHAQTEKCIDEITDTIWDNVMKEFLEADIRNKLIERGIPIDPQKDSLNNSLQMTEEEQKLFQDTMAKLKSIKDPDSAETKDRNDEEKIPGN
ncbi:MAG: hypothetical protein K9N06_06855 [Candidatus Cloacimonetes bacterium]|nr:hypothetical protein [Candidatus Cloacimonadota bacterium]